MADLADGTVNDLLDVEDLYLFPAACSDTTSLVPVFEACLAAAQGTTGMRPEGGGSPPVT